MKTNHRRDFRDGRASRACFSRYVVASPQAVADDGTMISAVATSGDHCCGKRGQRRDVAGAKKYVNSRIRRRNRDFLKKQLAEGNFDDE